MNLFIDRYFKENHTHNLRFEETIDWANFQTKKTVASCRNSIETKQINLNKTKNTLSNATVSYRSGRWIGFSYASVWELEWKSSHFHFYLLDFHSEQHNHQNAIYLRIFVTWIVRFLNLIFHLMVTRNQINASISFVMLLKCNVNGFIVLVYFQLNVSNHIIQ